MKPRNLLHALAHGTLVKLSLQNIFSRSENIKGAVKWTNLYSLGVFPHAEYGCSSLSDLINIGLIWKSKATNSRICYADPFQNSGKAEI